MHTGKSRVFGSDLLFRNDYGNWGYGSEMCRRGFLLMWSSIGMNLATKFWRDRIKKLRFQSNLPWK